MEAVSTHSVKTLDEDGFYNLVNSQNSKTAAKVTKKDLKPTNAHLEMPSQPTSAKGKQELSVSGLALNSELWTEKYKPTKYSEIIGNKQNVDKLISFLNNWKNNKKLGFPKSKEEGSNFRAALLSGYIPHNI